MSCGNDTDIAVSSFELVYTETTLRSKIGETLFRWHVCMAFAKVWKVERSFVHGWAKFLCIVPVILMI